MESELATALQRVRDVMVNNWVSLREEGFEPPSWEWTAVEKADKVLDKARQQGVEFKTYNSNPRFGGHPGERQ